MRLSSVSNHYLWLDISTLGSLINTPVHQRQDLTWLLLGVEDTGYVTIEQRPTNLLFLLFFSFFCPFSLFYIIHQLCLLHQVGAFNLHVWVRTCTCNYLYNTYSVQIVRCSKLTCDYFNQGNQTKFFSNWQMKVSEVNNRSSFTYWSQQDKHYRSSKAAGAGAS